MALIAVVSAMGVGTPLDLARAGMWWPDRAYEPIEPQPVPPPPISRRVRPSAQRLVVHEKRGHRQSKQQAGATQEEAKPRGPLLITVSIARQHLRIYDQNGLFAESPVSTGKPGHPTPMGVFSVIQKSKYHRSNLYSSAPMPYMQRITWSGVALHAGVVPGYPASHGCIRMPMAFAVKLWGWSRLGARVIIAPEDVTPTNIAHPLLATRAAAPQPASPSLPAAPGPSAPLATSSDGAGHTAPADDSNHPLGAALRPALTDRVRLADAEPGLPVAPAPARDGNLVVTDAPPARADVTPGATPDAPAASTAAAEAKVDPPAATAAAVTTGQASAKEPGTPAKAQSRDATPASPTSATPSAKAAPKDAAPAGTPPASDATAAAPKRTGHVAVLISRKTGRLYARQNFEPWFDVPVTIAQGDHPFGTHVFTATADPAEAGSLHWTVVSLPQLPKRVDATEGAPRRQKQPAPVADAEVAPLPVPGEALDRVTIPADVAAKITAALAPGGSVIVSDHGLGDETGLGTDFIVPLR